MVNLKAVSCNLFIVLKNIFKNGILFIDLWSFYLYNKCSFLFVYYEIKNFKSKFNYLIKINYLIE